MSGSFVFEPSDKLPQLVFCDFNFSAIWFDPITGYAYCASDGLIFKWDDITEPLQIQEWKSKVIVTDDYLNLGAARIVADYPGEVTFTLWANKQLIHTVVVSNKEIFRLPTGYRTDTYEFSVLSNVRIRAVHLAETPFGLKEA